MLQQDLDEKLDKGEYLNRLAEGTNYEDSLVRMEYDLKKVSKESKGAQKKAEKTEKKLKEFMEGHGFVNKSDFKALQTDHQSLKESFDLKPSVALT